MSESALIAYENPDGTCDLYWSHNGADEFYLKPYLEDVAAGDRPRTLPDVDPKYPDGTKEAGLEVADTLKTAVVPEPEHRHVPKRQVGNLIDFLAYEGFYYVTDNGVDLYYPVWTFPGVLVALREMIDLEVYPRDAFDATEGTVIDESSPVAALSEADFSASTFKPVRYRSFIDLHHLGIFQTIAGVVNTATQQSDLTSRGLGQEEYVNIIPTTTENIFEPYRGGNGVLVHFPWDNGNVAQRLRSLRARTASLRIEIGLRFLEATTGTPTLAATESFERELVAQVYREYGLQIFPESIQPHQSLLESLSADYAPNRALRGDRYRVIDAGDGSALLKPTEQYGKTGAVARSSVADDDVVIVDLDQTSSDFEGVVSNIDSGDIVLADVDTSSMPAVINSIQVIQRVPLEMAQVEEAPGFVREAYDQEIETAEHKDRLPTVRTRLESSFETISETKLPIGELQVTHDPEDIIWEALQFGGISEQIYGRFQFTDLQPHEVLLFNPDEEPFWFGFLLETPSTGFARYWRSEYDCECDTSPLLTGSDPSRGVSDTGDESEIAEIDMLDTSSGPLDDMDGFTSMKIDLEEEGRNFDSSPRTIEGWFPGEKSHAKEKIQELVTKARQQNVQAHMKYIGESEEYSNGLSRHHIKIIIDGKIKSGE